MADQFINARTAYIKVGSDTFAAELSSSFDFNIDMIETTNKSSTVSKSYIPDVYGATLTANTMIKADDTDGSLDTLNATFVANALAGTAATIIFVIQASSPTTTYSVSAYVETFQTNAQQGNVLEGNYTFRATGDVTVTQTST